MKVEMERKFRPRSEVCGNKRENGEEEDEDEDEMESERMMEISHLGLYIWVIIFGIITQIKCKSHLNVM